MFRQRIEIDDRTGKPLVRWEGRAWTGWGAVRKAEKAAGKVKAAPPKGKK